MCRLVSIDTNFNTKIMVADIKAEYINNISQKAGLCKNISHIYLFGSALKEECKEASDIDILVVSDIARSKLYKTKSFHLCGWNHDYAPNLADFIIKVNFMYCFIQNLMDTINKYVYLC